MNNRLTTNRCQHLLPANTRPAEVARCRAVVSFYRSLRLAGIKPSTWHKEAFDEWTQAIETLKHRN